MKTGPQAAANRTTHRDPVPRAAARRHGPRSVQRTASTPSPRTRALAAAVVRGLESLESRQLLAAGPVINEFVASPSNTTGLLDDYGLRPDWIELYNPTTAPINLTDWHLTDTKSNPALWTFPAGTTLPAGGYLVVFADNRTTPVGPGGKLHTNFALSADGEYLALTRPDNAVADAFDPFPSQAREISYGPAAPTINNAFPLLTSGPAGAAALLRVPTAAADLPANWNAWDFDDSEWTLTGQSGIGYDNDAGAGNYNPLLQTDLASELFGAGKNTSAFARFEFDVSGAPSDFQSLTLRMRYDDGFVAYLNGVKVAQANAPASPAWDSAATGTVDKNAGFIQFDLTPFLPDLRAGKNVLAVHGLNDANSSPDFLLMPEIVGRRVTFGLNQYMSTTSPGAANTPGAQGRVRDTEFSVDRGFFDAPFTLRIESDTNNAVIRYTTDGSLPTATTGLLYTGPITIDRTMTVRAIATRAGYVPSDVDAQTYIFPFQVLQQNGANLPPHLNWGHAGPDWAMDPDLVAGQEQAFVDSLKSVPSVSLSMPWNNWFNPDGSGLYASNNNRVDHPTSFEFIHPDGTKGVQAGAAVQLQGGSSDIGWRNDKLSMEVKFRERFGDSKLAYDVFGPGSGATEEFDNLILDAVFNHGWTYNGGLAGENQRADAKFITDQFIADLQNANGGVAPHGRFVHLYLNGLYWGMYYLHEKPDESFTQAYLGGNKEDYDVIKHNPGQVVAGSSTNYNDLLSRVRQSMSVTANYQAVLDKLDVVDFIDYMLINFWGGNNDWAHQNWYASYNRVDPAGRWRFHSWDAEHSLEDGNHAIANAVNFNNTGFNNSGGPTEIHQRLRANPEYRQLFADRIQKLMLTPGGILHPTTAAQFWQTRMNEVNQPLLAESARWGDNIHPDAPYTVAGWEQDMQFLLDNHFPARTAVVHSQLKPNTNPLYPRNTLAPLFSSPGGAFPSAVSVTISKPAGQAGTIYYTTDGSDPRLPGGAINPTAVAISSSANVPVPTSRLIRARIFNTAPTPDEWSAIVEATFIIGPAPALRIAEIMYNPAPPPAGSPYTPDDFEYLELRNTTGSPINPSGFTFTNGITYTFPAGSAPIPAGGRVVIAKNPAAFATRYPGVSALGPYDGTLSDSGERLTLTTQFGQLITSIVYSDAWYAATDGDGYSLTALNPAASDAVMSTESGWRASQPRNGTPGTAADDAFNNLTSNSIVINEVLATATGPTGNWIELRNTTNAPINVGGWWLSDDAVNRQKWQIPAGTTLPANGYLSFTQSAGFGAAFQLTGLGADLYLTSNDGAGGQGGYRDHVDFGPADPDVSVGRYIKSTGAADFVPLATASRNAPNAYPLVGPVVINEIMYNPGPAGAAIEFLEIRNITDATVSLAGWTFSDGITFTFGATASIAPNAYALVVAIDPDLFRATYSIPADVAIFGPYSGQLSNAGEKLELAKPGAPVNGTTPFIVVDRVNYDDSLPWPAPPDGTGPSLGRINAARYGNDVANWRPDTTDGTGGQSNAAAPVLFLHDFGYPGAPKISAKFSADVGASLTDQSITVLNLTTGQPLPANQVVLSWDPATQTATWQLPAPLADGNYRVTLNAAFITDAAARAFDGNSDGTPGDNATFDFFHLAGDANRDRSVDFQDLVKLAQNYNSPAGSGKTYADGDFNFDGGVDFNDLVLLAQRYNATLPESGAPVAGAARDPIALATSLGLATPTPPTPAPRAPSAPPKRVLPAPPPPPAPAPAPMPARAFGQKRIAPRVWE